MKERRIIQNSLDYIEQNLKAEITARELAEAAGFSLCHYYRLFQAAVGMPVMQYVLMRRLLGAVYEISLGRRMVDAALDYGFDTYAGFYRAFRRELGCTPAEYIKTCRVKKPYRINLFEEEHIMLTHTKINEALKNWSVRDEQISPIYYKSTGNKNENACYVGKDCVLKFSANLGNLTKSIEISRALDAAGFAAAVPIKSASGEDVVRCGEVYCCLTRRVEGEQLTAAELYGDGGDKARLLGEMIARLHSVLASVDAPVDDSDLFAAVTDWAMPTACEAVSLPQALREQYAERFGGLYRGLPRQIIHRDLSPGNVICSGDRWGFVDFELSERNVRIFDPCYAATAVLSETPEERWAEWIEVYRTIIRGYDSAATLTADERAALPYMILSNQLICVAWFSGQEKYADVFRTNKKMTEWIIDNFEKLRFE